MSVLERLLGRVRYRLKVAREIAAFRRVKDVHELPPIFHYWSNTHLRPMLEAHGFSSPDDFFVKFLAEAASRSGVPSPRFVSLGAGNCDTELRVARALKERGLERFVLECVEINPHMLQRGRVAANEAGLADCLRFVEADLNRWRAEGKFTAIVANQSLHHVVELEHLYDQMRAALAPDGLVVVSDMIGRNGHQRWPEALTLLQTFWRELPPAYRYNHQLKRHEEIYENWDCSTEGFEGVRAQDVLPLLVDRFDFDLFIGFGSVLDVFVDRGFGHNFDPEKPWDRAFVDRLHAADEEGLQSGALTPTHMFAVLVEPGRGKRVWARGLSPEKSIRRA